MATNKKQLRISQQSLTSRAACLNKCASVTHLHQSHLRLKCGCIYIYLIQFRQIDLLRRRGLFAKTDFACPPSACGVSVSVSFSWALSASTHVDGSPSCMNGWRLATAKLPAQMHPHYIVQMLELGMDGWNM